MCNFLGPGQSHRLETDIGKAQALNAGKWTNITEATEGMSDGKRMPLTANFEYVSFDKLIPAKMHKALKKVSPQNDPSN